MTLTTAHKKRLPLIVAGVAALALIIGGVVWWQGKQRWEATDNAFVAADTTGVSPQIDGYVVEVLVAAPVQDYAIRLLLATHPNTEYATADANKFFRAGASPRGAQSLILAGKVRALLDGRFNVSFEDIRKVYFPAMRHRVLMNFEAQAENVSSDTALAGILNDVKERADERR